MAGKGGTRADAVGVVFNGGGQREAGERVHDHTLRVTRAPCRLAVHHGALWLTDTLLLCVHLPGCSGIWRLAEQAPMKTRGGGDGAARASGNQRLHGNRDHSFTCTIASAHSQFVLVLVSQHVSCFVRCSIVSRSAGRAHGELRLGDALGKRGDKVPTRPWSEPSLLWAIGLQPPCPDR